MNDINTIVMKGEYGDLKFGNDVIAKISTWQMDSKPENAFLCIAKIKKIFDCFVIENYVDFIFDVTIRDKSYVVPVHVEYLDLSNNNIEFSGKERPQIKWHETISSNPVPNVWN
jgi:hypothetical protein